MRGTRDHRNRRRVVRVAGNNFILPRLGNLDSSTWCGNGKGLALLNCGQLYKDGALGNSRRKLALIERRHVQFG
jgi:hypothetical protein